VSELTRRSATAWQQGPYVAQSMF